MRPRSFCRSRLAPARAAWLVLALALAAPGLARGDDADTLFAEGAAAHDRGDLEGALVKYAEAFRLAPSFAVAANLGVVEAQLGRHRDAAQHLAFALARYPEGGDPEKRKRMAAVHARVLGYVGELRIEAPAGAQVRVDGEDVGPAPLALPVYADPGPHRVEILAPPAPPEVREVSALAGEVTDVRSTPPRPAEVPPSAPPQTPRAGPRTDPVIVVGGAGLALLGVGLGLTFTVLSSGAGSDADVATAELIRAGTNPCLGPTRPSACAEVQSDLEARDGLRDAAAISFVAGGVVALGTVAYVVVTSATGAEPEQTSIRLTPLLTPDRGGLAATGTF